MRVWRLLDLGAVDGYTMTNVFIAVAEAVSLGEVRNTLILNHPREAFANLGFHQEAYGEIDMDYCAKNGIPIVRRAIGGGAILDGPWEQDYFVIVHGDSDDCPSRIPEFYAKFLSPVVYALDRIGLRGERGGINDITVNGRKISGNGAVTIENAMVLGGDILLDLDIESMTSILRVPDEKYRNKIAESMAQWLTSVKKELGKAPPREEVKSYLIEGFEKELGITFEVGQLTAYEEERLRRYVSERRGDDWVFMKGISHKNPFDAANRCVKIKEDIVVCRTNYEAEELIRVTMMLQEGIIREIAISGDFIMVPMGDGITLLERELVGTPLVEEDVEIKVKGVFDESLAKVFGVTIKDFVNAIMKARENPLIK
ncbi:MAG: lipoate--protein ligase [Candidatus Geothermarchaeales archaeon]